MRKWNQSAIVGGVLVLFGGVAIAASLGLEAGPQGGVGPRLFPLAVSAVLVAIGLAELRLAHAGSGMPVPAIPGIRGVATLLALTAAYVVAIGQVGYLPSTAVMAPAAFAIFGIRRPAALVAAALLCPTLFHLLFFELLGIFPPYGARFDLLDILRAG